jgi:hypothetical protein
LASERLVKWKPLNTGGADVLTPTQLERMLAVMAAGWAPATHQTYGSGLLMFHVWCDKNSVAEDRRSPVSHWLMVGFIADCAGGYSKSAVENALLGVRAWHLVHGVRWSVDMDALKPELRGVENLAPPGSKRPLREPLRLELILRIAALMRDTPFDIAWWACLLTTFWSCSRLGEFTIKGDSDAFDARYHIARGRVSDKARDGNHIKDFHLPWTKVAKSKGEHVFWATQPGDADPLRAFVKHLAFNDPPDDGAHLFSYPDGTNDDGSTHFEPMRRNAFLQRLKDVCTELGETTPHGHGIRIGSILEYLLRGTEFAVGKVIGRWSSDAFEGYLRDHALVLAPYLQARPRIEAAVANRAMPMPRGFRR